MVVWVGCRSYNRVKGRSHTVEKRKSIHPHKPHACLPFCAGVSAWSMVWFRWGCTASCGKNVRCVGGGNAWSVLPSPCNTNPMQSASRRDSHTHPDSAQTRHTTSIATNSAPYTRLITTWVGCRCLLSLVSSVGPGVWTFLRSTHTRHHMKIKL